MPSPARTIGPRILDLGVALAGFVVLSPLMAGLAVAVRWRMGTPVLFVQPRTGLRGSVFRMYKFRTMTDRRGPDGRLLPDEERLTPFGAWMRRWSLDELPALVNVLKGEMALIGPRPLLPQYMERYTARQARRHLVKPGLTGWVQVNGRNGLTWEEKFALDVWYVDNRSLRLDLRILRMTLARVLRGEGVSAPGEATMPEFRGRHAGERGKNDS